MLAVHIYTSSEVPVQNAFAPLAAELAIQSASHMIDVARIENKVPPNIPKPLICFDEWNVWDAVRARGDQGAEEKCVHPAHRNFDHVLEANAFPDTHFLMLLPSHSTFKSSSANLHILECAI